MSVLTQIRNWFNLGTEETEVDGSSQDAASTETVEDSEVEN